MLERPYDVRDRSAEERRCLSSLEIEHGAGETYAPVCQLEVGHDGPHEFSGRFPEWPDDSPPGGPKEVTARIQWSEEFE